LAGDRARAPAKTVRARTDDEKSEIKDALRRAD